MPFWNARIITDEQFQPDLTGISIPPSRVSYVKRKKDKKDKKK
jgi:hypothetical protein